MTQHPQAGLLRAIADGKQIQFAYKEQPDIWSSIPHSTVLFTLEKHSHAYLFRIKPATITINGTELPKPVDPIFACGSQGLLRIAGHGSKEYYFNTREDRDAVYAKLVEILS